MGTIVKFLYPGVCLYQNSEQ